MSGTNDIMEQKREEQRKHSAAQAMNQNLNTNNSDPGENERKRFTLDIHKDLHYELKLQSLKQGKKMYELVEKALKDYFKNP
ncbi:hypothetical protein [Lentibacillus cibarius]|uniref:Uncharacterized protein n=1 Tax=Lentibacillus cibarius TaxID=2583219 RepID=A0A5S3QNC7_9BACI|nr:hypothetical protein [Lentibacillus cibarius]TMN22721.1 hypothetical protein FFL34_11900 [Lentibacillus cibarius]